MKRNQIFQHYRRPPWQCYLAVGVTSWLPLLVAPVFLVLTSVHDVVAVPTRDMDVSTEIDSGSTRNVASTRNSVCSTKDCAQAAKQIKDSIDPKVNPCDNFYQFACGNYKKTTPIPGYRSSMSSFSDRSEDILKQMHNILSKKPKNPFLNFFIPRYIRLAQSFYKSCMNTEYIEYLGLKPVRPILKELGGWPVLKKGPQMRSIDTTPYQKFWMTAPLKYRKAGFGYASFISISFGVDFKNSTHNMITISQPSLDLPVSYLVRGFKDPTVQAYYTYMVKIAEMFGASLPIAKDDMKNVVAFEIELAKIQLKTTIVHDQHKLNNRMTISELYKKFPFIPWWEEIDSRLKPYWYLSSPGETVIVTVPGYLHALKKLIPHVPERVKANYVVWRFVSSLVPYLTNEAQALRFQLLSKLEGIKKPTPRWMTCTSMVLLRLPVASSAIFIKNFFDKRSKKEITTMMEGIRAEFLLVMEALTWMKDETRRRAIEKLEAMFTSIAYPKELTETLSLTLYYNKLRLLDYNYLKNHFLLNGFDNDRIVASFGKPYDKTNWKHRSDVVIVNAYYLIQFNSINIPAGILGGAFYSKKHPQYMNYGAIAQVIGHELTHGFDDVGRQYDQHGNLNSWWDPSTLEDYEKKAQCMVNQYGNYSINVHGKELKINGVASLGENIADNGGIKQAYAAYNTWIQKHGTEKLLPGLKYNQKQLFWISAAHMWCIKYTPEDLKDRITTDPHTPAEYRVIGAFSNRPEFAADFACPADSKMNPEKKCVVW